METLKVDIEVLQGAKLVNLLHKSIFIISEMKVSVVLFTFDESNQKQVKDKNSFDMKLYKEANRQLNDKIDGIYNFKTKLDDFKSRYIMEVLKPKIAKFNGHKLLPLIEENLF